jgi:hypothetical protein
MGELGLDQLRHGIQSHQRPEPHIVVDGRDLAKTMTIHVQSCCPEAFRKALEDDNWNRQCEYVADNVGLSASIELVVLQKTGPTLSQFIHGCQTDQLRCESIVLQTDSAVL